MKFLLPFLFVCLYPLLNHAQQPDEAGYILKENVFYRSANELQDDYMAERCRLDIYYPEAAINYPTIVWFHGGGITGGNKYIPEKLKERGLQWLQ